MANDTIQEVWADNSDSTVNEHFSADVGFFMQGLTAGGDANLQVKGSKQYDKFKQSAGRTCSLAGGDPKISAQICQKPALNTSYDLYREWIDTTGKNPDIFNFELEVSIS